MFSYTISQMRLNMDTYLRIVDDKCVTHCSFILGKSRVTPLKVMSIPRLELTAGVVAVKLNCLSRSELEYPIHDTIYWTDSTLVLQYIRNESIRFQTFVANSIATIHDGSTPCQWRHVDTCTNPADSVQRGERFRSIQDGDLASWPEVSMERRGTLARATPSVARIVRR